MTEQYFLLEPFYIHSINSIISAQSIYLETRLVFTKARRFFDESRSIKLVSENIFRRVFLFFPMNDMGYSHVVCDNDQHKDITI